jgi:hypothetical protein
MKMTAVPPLPAPAFQMDVMATMRKKRHKK